MAPPFLKVQQGKLKDPAGKTVVLRGLSLTAIDHANSYGREFILNKAISEWDAKLLRLPTRQTPDISALGLSALYNLYKPFIDSITEKNCYAIIDLHRIGDPRQTEASDRAFWLYMANQFKDYPNVFFELYNEPTVSSAKGTISYIDFLAYVNRQISVVRSTGAKNLILCPGMHYDQLIKEVATQPPTDPVSDSQGLAQVAHLYPGGWARTNNDLFAEMDIVANTMPVFVTECGFDADRSQSNDVYGAYEDASQPTSQRWNFGKLSKQRMEAKGVHFTFWALNRLQDGWFPVPCDNSWVPRPYPRYDGQFYKDWLAEKKNSNQPTELAPEPAEPDTIEEPAITLSEKLIAAAENLEQQAATLRQLATEA